MTIPITIHKKVLAFWNTGSKLQRDFFAEIHPFFKNKKFIKYGSLDKWAFPVIDRETEQLQGYFQLKYIVRLNHRSFDRLGNCIIEGDEHDTLDLLGLQSKEELIDFMMKWYNRHQRVVNMIRDDIGMCIYKRVLN